MHSPPELYRGRHHRGTAGWLVSKWTPPGMKRLPLWIARSRAALRAFRQGFRMPPLDRAVLPNRGRHHHDGGLQGQLGARWVATAVTTPFIPRCGPKWEPGAMVGPCRCRAGAMPPGRLGKRVARVNVDQHRPAFSNQSAFAPRAPSVNCCWRVQFDKQVHHQRHQRCSNNIPTIVVSSRGKRKTRRARESQIDSE